MRFRIRALNANQQIITLSVDALDESDARHMALQQQLVPLSIEAAKEIAKAFSLARKRFSLLLFAQELHALATAGLSIVEALDALVEKELPGDTRTIVSRLVVSLKEGMRLSIALQQQRGIFPPLFIGIIQAAEGTSDLPTSLQRYIDYETRMNQVKHKIISAAIYPSILLLVGGSVAVFLMCYVVPRFAAVYQSSGRTLPWASQLLLSWGNFAGAHAAALFASISSLLIVIVFQVRRRLRDGGWWQFLKIIPGARVRLDLFELSRLYLTLGMLLEGGIPLQSALHLAKSVVSPARRDSITHVAAAIGDGERLSDAFITHHLSTPIAQRLLRVGERSGQLGAMLTRTANFYDGENTRWIERFTKAFEPALMAGIGLVIGLIVILLYMPIFDLAGSIQ